MKNKKGDRGKNRNSAKDPNGCYSFQNARINKDRTVAYNKAKHKELSKLFGLFK